MELFTIGHSNHDLETFIARLKQHGVTALADVRSHPYSRYLPHFNQPALKAGLRRAQLYYVFLGTQLGARPDDPACYEAGTAVYEKISATPAFSEGIERVLTGAKQHKIALMCAEQDPLDCHRAILVCQHLRTADLAIHHILKDGSLESHQHLEERLLIKHKLSDRLALEGKTQLSLFHSVAEAKVQRQQDIRTAYRLQGQKVAYVEKDAEQ